MQRPGDAARFHASRITHHASRLLTGICLNRRVSCVSESSTAMRSRLDAPTNPTASVCWFTWAASSGVGGLYLSYYRNVASGAAVVLVATAIFFIVWTAVRLDLPTRLARRRVVMRDA